MKSVNKPPLIVHIIYALKAGGLENGLVNIINHTPPDRYRHVIICLTEADDFADRILDKNVEVVELNKKPGHDFSLYWKVWRELRRLKPDIVHTRNLASLEMQFIALFSCQAKRVQGEHGRDIHDLKGDNPKFNLFRKCMSLLIHRYIPVSKDLSAWLENIISVPGKKISQIYNGVDQAKFLALKDLSINVLPQGFAKPESIIIGTVGRLATVKNQSSLIRALKILFDEQPDLKNAVRLLIVGDGPLRQQLGDVIAKCELEEYVWLPGNRDDIPEMLQAMDIFRTTFFGRGNL